MTSHLATPLGHTCTSMYPFKPTRLPCSCTSQWSYHIDCHFRLERFCTQVNSRTYTKRSSRSDSCLHFFVFITLKHPSELQIVEIAGGLKSKTCRLLRHRRSKRESEVTGYVHTRPIERLLVYVPTEIVPRWHSSVDAGCSH